MNQWEALAEIEKLGELKPDEARLLEQARAKGLAPAAKAAGMSWGEVAEKASGNIGSSAGNFLYNLTAPIHSPVQTAKGLTHLAAGVGSKIVGAADKVSEAVGGPDLQTPYQAETAEAPMKAVGQFYADRYGSLEGFKNAVAEDPVGVVGDASAVLTGGGTLAARAPGMVGRAGQAVANVGRAIDPVAGAGRAIAGTARAAAPVIGRGAEAYSGVGEGVLSEAYGAGRQGGQVRQTLIDNMTDPAGNARGVVDQAQDAVRGLRQQRGAEYNANMAATRADQTPLNIGAVRQELNNLRNDVNFRGIAGTGNTNAVNVLDEIERVIDQFENLPAGQGATAEGLDFLKRRIGEFRDGRMQGTADRRVVDRMYNAARDQVAQQVPDYADAMRGYEDASDLIDEVSRGLSVNDRATVDTTLRKLQSTMRNNANTSYGYRGQLLDELEARSPGIRAALAGQALSSWAPRGINRGMVSGGLGGAMAMGGNPVTGAGMALASSPRIAGNVAVRAGQAAQAFDDVTGAIGLTPDNVAAVTIPGQQVGRAATEAAPSQQESRALDGFQAAIKSGDQQAIARSMSLLAQIVARETGQKPEEIMSRLQSFVGGQ